MSLNDDRRALSARMRALPPSRSNREHATWRVHWCTREYIETRTRARARDVTIEFSAKEQFDSNLPMCSSYNINTVYIWRVISPSRVNRSSPVSPPPLPVDVVHTVHKLTKVEASRANLHSNIEYICPYVKAFTGITFSSLT